RHPVPSLVARDVIGRGTGWRHHPARDPIKRHIEDAAREEWPSMAKGRASLAIVPPALAEALRLALALKPNGDRQAAAQRELVTSLQPALAARRLRIAISRSTVDWVKWSGVIVLAFCLLLAIAVHHADNLRAGIVALGICATGVAASMVLIASHNRPF